MLEIAINGYIHLTKALEECNVSCESGGRHMKTKQGVGEKEAKKCLYESVIA